MMFLEYFLSGYGSIYPSFAIYRYHLKHKSKCPGFWDPSQVHWDECCCPPVKECLPLPFLRLHFFKRSSKTEASQTPAQPWKNLGYCLRLWDRNSSVCSPVLESYLTCSCYCKNFSDLCFPKEMSGSSLEWTPAQKGWLCLLQAVRFGVGPFSDTRQGRLAKLWGPLEALASNMLVLAGQI